MSEKLEIKYPAGLVAPSPRKIANGTSFRFICNDPGTVEIEFDGESPLVDGTRIVGKDKDLTASKPGKHHFKCTLIQPDGTRLDLQGGGEIEVSGN